MVQGLVAAAFSVAARCAGTGEISRRLYGKSCRRLQAALRRQGAVAFPAPFHSGGAMRFGRPSWPDLFGPSTSCFPAAIKTWIPGPGMTMKAIAIFPIFAFLVAPASADAAFQTWLQALWPQAQAL